MNHLRAMISAGLGKLRGARPTNATEGAQFAVAQWLYDGKLSVRYGADVHYPKLRLSSAPAEDGWGVAEVEIRQPDGKIVTSKFQVEILTHRSDSPDDAVIVSKETIDEWTLVGRKIEKLQPLAKELERNTKELEKKLSAWERGSKSESAELAGKKPDAAP